MKNQQSAFTRFLLGFVAFILCIILFVTTISTILIADIRILLSKDNLKELINDVIFTTSAPVRRSAALPLTGREKLEEFTTDVSVEATADEMIKWIYDVLEEEYGEELPLTLEEVQEIVEESTLKEFVSEKCASAISDFCTGESTFSLTTEEIVEQIELNKELLEKTFDIEITAESLAEMEAVIEENEYVAMIQEEGVEAVIVSAMGEEAAEDLEEAQQILETVRAAVSTRTLLAGVGLCGFLIVLLFMVRGKRYPVAMRNVGVTLLLAGLVYLLPAALVLSSQDVLVSLMDGMIVVADVVVWLLKATLPISASVTGLGFVLLVAGIVVGCVLRKRAKYMPLEAEEAPVEVEATAPQMPEAVPEIVAEETAAEEALAEETAEEAVTEEPAEETEEPVVEEAAEEPVAEETAEEEKPEPETV